MTNQTIILLESIKLMEQGVLAGTGKFATVDNKQFEIPEEIHTFSTWKELGYQVQKGEKAVASFTIWKHTSKKSDVTGEEIENMFMKKASFFKRSQVKEIS